METCSCYIILAENFFAYSLLVMYCSQGKNARNNFVKTKRTLKSWMKKCEDNINVYFWYKCFDRLVFVNQMKSIFTQFYIQYYRTNILQEVNALAFEFRIVLGGGESGHGRELEQNSTSSSKKCQFTVPVKFVVCISHPVSLSPHYLMIVRSVEFEY